MSGLEVDRRRQQAELLLVSSGDAIVVARKPQNFSFAG